MVHLISYDLLSPGKSYENLINRIRSLGARQVLLSQWVMVTASSADAIWRDLTQYVDANDRLLVTELTRSAQWGAALATDRRLKFVKAVPIRYRRATRIGVRGVIYEKTG